MPADGLHFIADVQCERGLDEPALVQEFVNAVVAATGLKERKRIVDVLDAGVSVIAEIATSHVAVHTWPEYELLTLDVYSCVTFDVGIVERLIDEFFIARSWPTRHVVRRFGIPL